MSVTSGQADAPAAIVGDLPEARRREIEAALGGALAKGGPSQVKIEFGSGKASLEAKVFLAEKLFVNKFISSKGGFAGEVSRAGRSMIVKIKSTANDNRSKEDQEEIDYFEERFKLIYYEQNRHDTPPMSFVDRFRARLRRLDFTPEAAERAASAVEEQAREEGLDLSATPVAAASETIAQEPARPPLPERAPALWAKDKQPNDTPPDFIERHYKQWCGSKDKQQIGENLITRPDIARFDHALYLALGRWLAKPGNTLPFDLPTKRELMEREAAQGKPDEVKAARRTLSRWQRREALTIQQGQEI